MADLVKSLTAARTALESGKRPQALGKLLVAWRALRHPRIAALIDHVSDELVAKAEPIRGKTAAARIEAWYAVEAKREPADLGRLLQTPWPGTWQKALPILTSLLEWPDDPRLAMALARIVDATPYDVWTSASFYRPLFERLAKLRDLRTLPLLRAQASKEKSEYYDRGLEERALHGLEHAFPDGPPELAPEVEAAVATLEARYRERMQLASAKAQGEAAYLAAIYADPDDVALRAVYADWLLERGDPRGELITLQLARAAGRTSEDAEVRERKLLEQHGRAWTGALDHWFADARFEGGFVVGGTLRDNPADVELADPAWRLVRVIESGGSDARTLELLDRLASLRAIHQVTEATASTIASGPRRALTELSFESDRFADGPGRDHPIATCDALPELRVLGLTVLRTTLAWLAEAPVLDRIERLVVGVGDHVTALLEAVARHPGSLRELELVAGARSLHDGTGWSVVLRRDSAPGPFTRCIARCRSARNARSFVDDLEAALAVVPASWLRVLEVESSRKLTLKAEDRARLATAVARFAQLETSSVPWQVPLEPPTRAAGRKLVMRLHGEGLLDPKKVAAVWRSVVDELGQSYDSYEIGHGPALRPLGDKPVERLHTWAANPRALRFDLVRDGAPCRLSIGRPDRGGQVTYLELVTDRSPEQILQWLVGFLDLAKFETGHLFPPEMDTSYDAFDLHAYAGPWAGWLVVFGPRLLPVLPPQQVAALGNDPELRGIIVASSKRNLVVAAAPSPEETTPERLRALAARLREVVARNLPAALGYDFSERVHAILAPAAHELGLSLGEPGTPTSIQFVQQERRLVARLLDPLDTPRVDIQLQQKGDRTYHVHDLRGGPAKTRAALDKALAAAAKAARAEGPAWFARPPKQRR